MKKIFMSLAVIGAAFLISCGVSSKAKSFAEKVYDASGDPEELAELNKEMDEYTEDLSEEEKLEFLGAYMEKMAELKGAK